MSGKCRSRACGVDGDEDEAEEDEEAVLTVRAADAVAVTPERPVMDLRRGIRDPFVPLAPLPLPADTGVEGDGTAADEDEGAMAFLRTACRRLSR